MRALKYAVGLAGEVELGFAYRGRTLSELYGAGDELFEAWYPLGDDPAAALPEIVEAFAPDVIHSHNLPDELTVLALDSVDVPVIHDVHDMQSLRRTPYEDGFPEPDDPPALERRAAEESAALMTISPELVAELAARYRLPGRVVAYANYALGRDLPRGCRRRARSTGRRGSSTRGRCRPTAATTTCATCSPRSPRRACRSTSTRRARCPSTARSRASASTTRCPLADLLRELVRATTSAGRASTPASTAPTSTPRCRTSSTSTSAAACR